jgi:hypothetical protein
MAIRIRASRAVVAPAGDPPSFKIQTDLPYSEVEVTIDPLLFNRILINRRRKENFYTSQELLIDKSHTASYTLDRNAWLLLRNYPYLYYRAIAYDAQLPANRKKVEVSVKDNDPQSAPSVYIVPSGTRPPPLKRRVSGKLKWIRVVGNQIVNEGGDLVVLRGVNRSGMEYTDRRALDPNGVSRPTSREAAGITKDEIMEIVNYWKANIIRLPINQEWALTRADYLTNIDRIIEWAAAEGAYVLLSLHWFDTRREFGKTADGSINHVPPMPEENSVRLWSMLASRYRQEPAVLYDIFNEPHVPLADDKSYSFKPPVTEEGWLDMWHSWIRRIEATIHRENNRALIFVSGWDWGLNLRSFPVPFGGGRNLPNAVYSTHVYYFNTPGRSTATTADFEFWFGFTRLRSKHPIFVGEWGGEETNLAWGKLLEQYLQNLHSFKNGIWQGLVGWTAWSWADKPLLVERGEGSRLAPDGSVLKWRTFVMDGTHNKPTKFGEFVHSSLLKQPLPPFNVLSHIWQEFHNKASTTVYTGYTNDDRKVVENRDATGILQPKQRLHLCFQEKTVSTIDVMIRSGTYYACWQIIAANGNLIKEHKQFTQANYNNSTASARLQTGKHGWLWDGRNNAANPIFVPPGIYRSRIIVKDDAGNQILQSDASIIVEGNPYLIFIMGLPKTNAELRAEFSRPALNNRFLDPNGERTARDCWIIVYRGVENEGHVVFLGQGTEEATKAEGFPDFGAIATPHSRDFKGWIRKNPKGVEANPDRIQIEDLSRTDELIQLFNIGGPPPNNPYCDSDPNTPYKDGVQAHGGNAKWTTNVLSVGCTTVSPIIGSTAANPGSVWGRVRSLNSDFGNWGNPNLGENVATAGPKFLNKQTSDTTVDALISDEHAAPELKPPQHTAPLHMQPTMQQGVFGGFKGYEIPQNAAVDDDPNNQLRIRMRLQDYVNGSMYYQYHHAVVFSHKQQQVGNGFRITVWIPRKVIRGWNGNLRNLLINGNIQIAWYIERRLIGGMVGPPELISGLYPIGASAGSYAALQPADIGKMERTWKFNAPLAPGRYVSVFKYKVQLRPYAAGDDTWVEEVAATDLFSVSGQPASIAAERIVTEGNQQFTEGVSELIITTIE